jgi:hypothetical protein
MPAWKTFYMGVLAGAYIAFGSCLAISIGGACQGMIAAGNLGAQKMIFGAFGLPFGLLMVVAAGGELFTGNTAFLTAAMAEVFPRTPLHTRPRAERHLLLLAFSNRHGVDGRFKARASASLSMLVPHRARRTSSS